LSDLEQQLVDDVARFDKDPEGYADYAFPWGEQGILEDEKGLRTWQRKILRDIGSKLQNPSTRFQPIQIAVASGHGIGKSALISIIDNWAMATCEDCKVLITANTDTQLRTKTMPEVTKWAKLSIIAHWFEVTASAIYSKVKDHIKTWRTDAVPWSAHNTEAFAGLHNKKKRIVIIFDEASKIDDKIWEVTEGALTDEDTEIIWIAFGNPTRNTGRFKDCFGKYKHRWITYQIDSREVEGTNKVQIQKWLEDHGEDSDFFKVRVRGMFPSASFKQFISTTDADRAFGKHLLSSQYDWAPKILTLDPAWEGDDELVIGIRQGLMFNILSIMPKNDNDVFVANVLARFEDEYQADAVFIDGGYGTGVVSVGRTLRRKWQLVWFGEESSDPGCKNKRAEMWNEMKKWLKEGGAIPKDHVLYQDLIGPETVPRLDGKILLESKADMKARGLPSPGRADALALSFAYPVAAKDPALTVGGVGGSHKAEYDPYERA
jgi:hypothetical protein